MGSIIPYIKQPTRVLNTAQVATNQLGFFQGKKTREGLFELAECSSNSSKTQKIPEEFDPSTNQQKKYTLATESARWEMSAKHFWGRIHPQSPTKILKIFLLGGANSESLNNKKGQQIIAQTKMYIWISHIQTGWCFKPNKKASLQVLEFRNGHVSTWTWRETPNRQWFVGSLGCSYGDGWFGGKTCLDLLGEGGVSLSW